MRSFSPAAVATIALGYGSRCLCQQVLAAADEPVRRSVLRIVSKQVTSV